MEMEEIYLYANKARNAIRSTDVPLSEINMIILANAVVEALLEDLTPSACPECIYNVKELRYE